MSASHDGLDFQAGLVRRMLTDIGLSETDLRCDAKLKARHNCSGNHTGFLAASVHHGWDIATYQQPGHPAQIAALQTFAACTGVDPAVARHRRRRLRHRVLCDAGDGGRDHVQLLPESCPRSAPRCARARSSSRGRREVDTDRHARPGRRHLQERRRGPRCRLAARRARVPGQSRRRSGPSDEGRRHWPSSTRRRRLRRSPPAAGARPAAGHERRRRRGRRTARRRPLAESPTATAASASASGGAVHTKGRGGALASAPPQPVPAGAAGHLAQASSAFRPRRSSRTTTPITMIAPTTMPTTSAALLLDVVVAATVFGPTLK